jgi:hypothetical protein
LRALENCENMFGRISPYIEKRIRKYIANPTFDNWDDIQGIIINPEGQMITIWRAMIEFDSTFPRTGRTEDFKGNIIKEWERIPEPFEFGKG